MEFLTVAYARVYEIGRTIRCQSVVDKGKGKSPLKGRHDIQVCSVVLLECFVDPSDRIVDLAHKRRAAMTEISEHMSMHVRNAAHRAEVLRRLLLGIAIIAVVIRL